MTITKEKLSADIERKIAIGMITDKPFLRDVLPIIDPELLQVPFVRTVARWCDQYWSQYQDAPKAAIMDVYQAQLRKGAIPETERPVLEDFLGSISREWMAEEEYNSEFWLDEAERYLDRRAMETTAEDVRVLLSTGDMDDARELLEGYKRIRRPVSHSVDPFSKEIIERAFEERQQPLLKFPGAIGHFLNHLFVRDSLVGIMAPEKRGKSWMLQEIALRAVKSGRKVAFFAVGDMTRDQMVRRIATRITGCNYIWRETGKIPVPVLDCLHNQRGTCTRRDMCEGNGPIRDEEGNVARRSELFALWDGDSDRTYIPCSVCRKESPKHYLGAHWWEKQEIKLLTPGKARRAARKWIKRYGERLRLYEYGYWELNTAGIEAELTRLKEQEDFLADFVIVDYADNMGPEDPRETEERHRQNRTWGAFSALRKRWHICVVTATQADAASYGATDLTMSNFSEDKRKLGHVTAMLALNQRPWEKREGIMRIGTVVAREVEFYVDRQVVILQSLQKGNPVLASYVRRKG